MSRPSRVLQYRFSSEKTKALSAIEVERAKMLQHVGKWLHIWRIVGKRANISVFNVKDGAELHEILTSLPLYRFMKIKVVALVPIRHPSKMNYSNQSYPHYSFPFGDPEIVVISDGPLNMGIPEDSYRGLSNEEIQEQLLLNFLPIDKVVIEQNISVLTLRGKRFYSKPE